nr:e3 ubiquitin-protein ligase march4 [Quercus suber]
MAAYTTGASWGFPSDVPSAWSQDDVDVQIQSEHDEPQAGPGTRVDTERQSNLEHDTSIPSASAQSDQDRPRFRPRTCRICFDTVLPTSEPLDEVTAALPSAIRPKPRVVYESSPGDGGRLLRPCRCKGSQKYVHEECLQAWRLQDPLEKRNYWQCPTCLYKYKLQRLSFGSWISSAIAQITLTIAIFVTAMFVLGFVADPIINMYIDPHTTVAKAVEPGASLTFEDESLSWTAHFIKGLGALGLLGFAKVAYTMNPFPTFTVRNLGFYGRGRPSSIGPERVQQLNWVVVVIGVAAFLWAVWKGVRAWSRRALKQACDRVVDVSGPVGEEGEDD